MAYTFDETIFSDLYKDVYGTRPRSHEFYDATNDRKQAIWDSLLFELDREMGEQAERERRAISEFETRIAEMGQLGAEDVTTAIRWILEAEDYDDYDLMYGSSKVCYEFGLPYSFGLNIIIDRVCSEMLAAREENV